MELKIKDTPPSYNQLPNRHSKDLVSRKVNRTYQVNDGNLTTSSLPSSVFESSQDSEETETVDFRGSQLSLLNHSLTMEALPDVDSIMSSYYNHHRGHVCSNTDLTTQSFIQCDDPCQAPALRISSSDQQPKVVHREQVESKGKKFQPISYISSRSSKLFRNKRNVM